MFQYFPLNSHGSIINRDYYFYKIILHIGSFDKHAIYHIGPLDERTCRIVSLMIEELETMMV